MGDMLADVASRTIGTIEAVAPHQLSVLLDVDAPHGTALGMGDPLRFPRINGFVLLPNESGALVGVVTWIGIERAPYPKRPGLRDFGLVDLPFPLRRLTVSPVGTLVAVVVPDGPAYELRRGVLSFPTVGDPVVLPTTDQLHALIESRGSDARVFLGTSALAGDAKVHVDPDKLFGRHLAVLGNTGSGKSCSVAGMIRWSIKSAANARDAASRAGPPNARFVVLDPNGEYSRTFSDLEGARLFRVGGGKGAEPMRVPAWIWNSQEWAAFTQATAATQRPLLFQALRNLRAGRTLAATSEVKFGQLARAYRSILDGIIAMGPSAFGDDWGTRMRCGGTLKNLQEDLGRFRGQGLNVDDEIDRVVEVSASVVAKRRFDYKGSDAFNSFTSEELEGVREAFDKLVARLPEVDVLGGPSEDAPLPFDAKDLASHLQILAGTEEFAAAAQYIETMVLRVRAMLADTRLAPIVAPTESMTFEDWLAAHLGVEGATTGQVAVLDLSLVPADVLVLAVAVIGRVVFEALQRYRRAHGVELPTVMVLEEAHAFIRHPARDEPSFATPARMCREAFERIAREGRKFGLGLVLSSQRPSELSATVLAQCNTFLLHRLVNDRDQDLVARLVPDNLGGLLRELPSLPSQQAVLLGWATNVPLLVEMRTLPAEQRPQSSDPAFWDVWTGESARPLDWAAIVADWTGAAG